MKESEFIELLNLYVDHEITKEDAARLEAEVTSDPDRRRIYRQYCSMDKACRMLADQFQETAPAADTKIIRTSPWTWGTGFATAGLAAAACFAVLVVVHNRMSSQAAAPAAAVQVAQAAPAPIATPTESAVAIAAYDRQLHPVVALRSLYLDDRSANPAPVLNPMAKNDPLAWISRIQTGTVPQLNMQPVMLQSPSSNLAMPSANPAQPTQTQAEMAAFRFFYR